MSPQLLVWIAAVMLQSALMGRNMYALICLTDLENDFINPFDLSSKLNTWVVPEYAAEAFLTALLLASGNWFAAGCHLAVLLYMVHLWTSRKVYVDTTDAFRQLPHHKRQRLILLIAHLVLFVLVVYRLVEAAIHSLLTPAGRAMTKKLLHEAAASIHGY